MLPAIEARQGDQSVTTVRDIVEDVLGAAAVNDYYEVGSDIAIGLPAN